MVVIEKPRPIDRRLDSDLFLLKLKNTPSKVAHNRPPTFFLCTGPAAQTAQTEEFMFQNVA